MARVDEIAADIFQDPYVPDFNIQFNQFLVRDDGMRKGSQT